MCWLFAERNNHLNRSWIDGVAGDLKNMNGKIEKHEKSDQHKNAARAFYSWTRGETVDAEIENQRKLNVSFWTKVLQRLVSIILTMSALNMAFRGSRESIGEGVCEGGNFLGVVALVAQYDDVLREVIFLPKRATKYLSPVIQNELISLLGTSLRKALVDKINRAPFWSVILDTTSDITRIDQLSVVIRWVNIRDDSFEINETFLGFVVVTEADAQGIVDTKKTYLVDLGLSFSRLRGQCYDGASVMSGVRGGVQK